MNAPNASDASAAIAALDAQRALLGDAVVDAAIAALRASQGGGPASPPAAAPAEAPASQRLRQVSVLFVDVAESTRLLRGVDVEDAPAVLDAAVQRFAACVQEAGGLVLRYTGDGLKAAFGTQGTREDEAERAVQAGLAILAAAEAHAAQLRQTLGVDGFAVRVGIHTGSVVLGGGAEADRTALGDAVHVAARMEQSAPLGRLRISNDTHAQVRGLFRVEAQAPLMVKGLDEPLHTWLVLGRDDQANGDRSPQRGLEGVHSPMVGRDAELAVLLESHEESVSTPALRVVTVLADAGIGKTRLRQEFLWRLGALPAPPWLLQARGHPSGDLQAYGLLRQVLARWLSIADDLDAQQARQLLEAGLRPWLAEGAEALSPIRADTRVQAVGQLIGLDYSDSPAVRSLSPRELRRVAFGTLVEVLHAIARRHGLVLVLDDLHWADAGTLEFIRELAQPADVPLLILLLSRPVLREQHPDPLASPGTSPREMVITPLGGQHGPALAQALLAPLPEAPAALQQLLVERADGNPFYMEELLRMLIDDGVIDARERPWRLQKHWQSSMRVPATLVGVLQARLDSLPADELAALQQASIVGSVFWDSAVQAIDGRSPLALPALQQRRLVVPRDTSAFAHEPERAFHHQILHDVTYGTVLGKARREGHARVARWLAERVADRAGEFLGITAEHFEKAGDSAQALDYYDRAQIDAERRFAHDAALTYIDRALRQPALTSPVWRFQLVSSRHHTLEAQGRVPEAAAALLDMEAMAEALDHDGLRADLCSARMLQADREGRADEAERLAEQAILLGERGDWPAAVTLGHGEIAWLSTLRQDYDRAQHHVALGIEWARRTAQRHWREGGYPAYELQLRSVGIESLLIQARWFEAAQAVRETLATMDESRLHDRFSLRQRLARALQGTGDLEGALAAARLARADAESTDKPGLQAAGESMLANVLLDLERFDEAFTHARAAEAIGRAIEDRVKVGMALRHLGQIHQAQGRAEEARTCWQEAESILVAMDATADVNQVRCELAWLDAQQGRVAEAHQAVVAILWPAGPDAATDTPGGDDAPGGTDAEDLDVPTTNHSLARAILVLEAAGDAQRAQRLRLQLRRHLQRQLDAAPDDAARARLVQAHAHWRLAADVQAETFR